MPRSIRKRAKKAQIQLVGILVKLGGGNPQKKSLKVAILTTFNHVSPPKDVAPRGPTGGGSDPLAFNKEGPKPNFLLFWSVMPDTV